MSGIGWFENDDEKTLWIRIYSRAAVDRLFGSVPKEDHVARADEAVLAYRQFLRDRGGR